MTTVKEEFLDSIYILPMLLMYNMNITVINTNETRILWCYKHVLSIKN